MSSTTKKSFFLLFFALVFFSCSLPYLYGDLGIDASWHESLVMSINKELVFGKDFIFNYGPLGYLNTLVLPKYVSPYLMLGFHFFMLLNYLFLIKLSFDKAGKKWPLVACLAIIVFLPWGFFADTSFTLFYFLIFWLIYLERSRSIAAIAISVVLCLLIFFIKVNLSLIAIGIFVLSNIYMVLSKKLSLIPSLISLALLFAGIYGFAILLNVDLGNYLIASTKIIDAYQDAMATMILSKKELLFVLAFVFLIVLLVLGYILLHLSYFTKNVFLYILIALAWFLSFKQAFTATGHYNVFGFFLFMPPLALLIYLFAYQAKGKNHSGILFILVLIFQLMATQGIRLAFTSYNLKNFVIFYFPSSLSKSIEKNPLAVWHVFKEKNPYNYFDKLVSYKYEDNFKNEIINKQRILPDKILRKIGSSSVDIVPWEISYLFFNKLNYNPRPIIQTYQANSDWLATQNENKYFSKSAPKFVLANVNGFREQSPYWVDKGVYLSLYKNYSLIDTAIVNSDTLYLFEKTKSLSLRKRELVSNKIVHFNELITIQSNQNPIFIKANVSYSFLGKIARLFFQPPYLYANLEYKNGQKETFRIPPPILKGGVLINKKVSNSQDFVNYQIFKGKKSIDVQSISFEKRFSWGFDTEISYSIEEIQ
jgi:hypothetical protein